MARAMVSRIKLITEIMKNVAEVIALFVAAYWAYDKFLKIEAPQLKERFEISHELSWDPSGYSTHCFGTWEIRLKNIGKSEVAVESAFVKMWLIPNVTPDPTGRPSFINPEQLVDKIEPVETVTAGGNLVHPYAPDVSSHETFSFLIKKQPNQIAVFSFGANGDSLGAYDWDRVCSAQLKKPAG